MINVFFRSRLNFYEIQDLPLFLSRFWALKRECSELHDRWKVKKQPKRKVKIESGRAQTPNHIFVRKVQTTSWSSKKLPLFSWGDSRFYSLLPGTSYVDICASRGFSTLMSANGPLMSVNVFFVGYGAQCSLILSRACARCPSSARFWHAEGEWPLMATPSSCGNGHEQPYPQRANPHCSAPRDKSQILQTGCKYNWTDLIRYWLICLKIYKLASNPRSSTPARLLFSSKMRSFANPGQAAP